MKKRLLLIFSVVVLIGTGVGIWRGQMFDTQMRRYEALHHKHVVIDVVAQGDAVYGKNGQLSFDGGAVHVLEPFELALPGKLKIQGYGEQAVYRGDMVRVAGSFYPTRGSRVGSLSYAKLTVVQHTSSWFEDLRRDFVSGMTTALPEPHASFGLGLLIGQRATLPDDVSEALAVTGLTHIIAVSGYNLTILVAATRRFGNRLSKYQTMVVAFSLIISFVLVTGFSASIIRAALVSMLSLLAWYYGRTFRPVLLLLLVAAVTAMWNPLYLWRDIGWYLSFLAFFGVLVLAPLFTKRFLGTAGVLTALLVETIAAQVMTAPLILFIFNEVSLISLVSNVLVVPFVPFAMLFGLVAGLAGMIVPVLSGWLAVPATLVMTYMLDMVRLLATTPHAVWQGALDWPVMSIVYVAIGILCFALWRRTEVKYGIIEENEEVDSERDV